MTRHLIVVILIFLTGCETTGKETGTAQTKETPMNSNETEQIDSIQVLMGCGYAATYSEQFKETKELVTAKNYLAISKSLSSKDELSRILSAIALEELNKRNLYPITAEEQNLISGIRQSKTRYYICEGCTGHYHGIVSDIFEGKTETHLYKSIRYRIGLAD